MSGRRIVQDKSRKYRAKYHLESNFCYSNIYILHARLYSRGNMDTLERGILRDAGAKHRDEEAGLDDGAVKEQHGSQSDDGSRQDLQDGEYSYAFNKST